VFQIMAANIIFLRTGILFAALLAFSSNAQPVEFQILLIGNSHSSKNDLPELIQTLIEQAQPGTTVHVHAVPRWGFLADRLIDKVTQKTLDAKAWTHVILQAQKYSSSGRYYYPTDAAEEWIRRVRQSGATPILFPEWARRGNNEEGQRIYELHLQIAARESACVAPVGFAWQLAQLANPSIRLHARDGNHSNANGALLTAFVLYQAITGDPATDLPDIGSVKTDADIQKLLRESASEAHSAKPGCPIPIDDLT
jgi:diadenosine tetraphosphate (Ap4A) HIT family hydrolase